jgi:hypothetical protein
MSPICANDEYRSQVGATNKMFVFSRSTRMGKRKINKNHNFLSRNISWYLRRLYSSRFLFIIGSIVTYYEVLSLVKISAELSKSPCIFNSTIFVEVRKRRKIGIDYGAW